MVITKAGLYRVTGTLGQRGNMPEGIYLKVVRSKQYGLQGISFGLANLPVVLVKEYEDD